MSDLSLEMMQFTGTSQYYKHFGGLLYTDGVKHFADNCGGGAYWFLDIVASVQDIIKNEEFVSITLDVKGNKADVTMTDGGKGKKPKILYQQHIEYTDAHQGEWKFFKDGDVLMVTSEY